MITLFQSCLLFSSSLHVTGAHKDGGPQAPLSIESSRQECWSQFPFPSPKEQLIMFIYDQEKKLLQLKKSKYDDYLVTFTTITRNLC